MAESEQRLDFLGVEPAVTDIDAFLVFHVRAASICVKSMGRGVLDFHREGERKLAAWIDLAENNVSNGIAGL